jgi:hypothetical protein
MKKTFSCAIVGVLMIISTGCGGNTPQQEAKEQLSKVHPLTDEERNLAISNAKSFFNRPWPTNVEGQKSINGSFINCRPSDSNNNNYVSCSGYKPNVNSGALEEITMYCGYKPELVGCSNEDTVK